MTRFGFLWRLLHATRCRRRKMVRDVKYGCVECRYCGWNDCQGLCPIANSKAT